MSITHICRSHPGLLENILEAVRQVVVITDLDGRVMVANQVVSSVFGFRPEDLAGHGLDRIFTPDDLIYLWPNILHLARSGQAFEGEAVLQRKNGEVFFSHLAVRPSSAPDQGVDLIIFCIQDIDRQKHLEQALKETRYEDLVKVANGIAHEIRNPLVGIGGFAGRLYKSCRNDLADDKYYDYIISNLKKIEGLIKKVDYLVTLPKPTLRPESLPTIVEEVTAAYRDQFEARHIDCRQDLDEIILPVDRDLVLRALSILVENALDAMGPGGSLHFKGNPDERRYRVCLTDSGSGIAPADLPFIFNPFFSTKPTGAGIDLAAVKRIMEGHGGNVEAESALGQGTTMTLWFPMERRRQIRVVAFNQQF